METPIVVANWKMNPQKEEEAGELASFEDKKKVVICPPFAFLSKVRKTVKRAEVGAQNCFFKNLPSGGAFTGEISSAMLKNLGCSYVLVGHSERRQLSKTESKQVGEKVKTVLASGMTPIVCIGEKEEGVDGREYIKRQLTEELEGVSVKKIIIAYEPIFAIGTGNPCSVEEAEKKKVFIKSTLAKKQKGGENVPVLYGGSVNAKNASLYIKSAGFQGLLVGGSSLKSKEFNKILESVK